MMKKSYTLNVKEPCSQNWDSMDVNQGGKYCKQCSKNVIDLTNFSDYEILTLLKQTNGGLCGRITQKQTERVLVLQKTKNDIPGIRKMLAGILLLSTAVSDAHVKSNSIQKEQVQNKDSKGEAPGFRVLPSDTLKNIFQGTITDKDTHEPLAGAGIIISGTTIGTAADIDGKFSIKIPNDKLTDSIHFEIFYVAYEKKHITISKNNLFSEHSLSLSPLVRIDGESVTVSLGAIELKVIEAPGFVGEISIERKPKWWHRKKH